MDFDFISSVPVEKGWSEDRKYHVTARDGAEYLLRISPIERYEVRAKLFKMQQECASAGVSMCDPVEFGTSPEGVHILFKWVDGEDLYDVLPRLSDKEQYALGVKSGEMLKKIHSLPAPPDQEDWYTRFNRKTDLKINKYIECPLRFKGDDKVIGYIKANRELLRGRPQCFQHGDYHIGNMMVKDGELVIIDFDRFDFGDPYEEFNRIVWCAAASPHFATGRVDGYFSNRPPMEFFRLLAFYIASNTLSSVYWAISFGQREVDTMLEQTQQVLSWFDGMQNPVPNWYLGKV